MVDNKIDDEYEYIEISDDIDLSGLEGVDYEEIPLSDIDVEEINVDDFMDDVNVEEIAVEDFAKEISIEEIDVDDISSEVEEVNVDEFVYVPEDASEAIEIPYEYEEVKVPATEAYSEVAPVEEEYVYEEVEVPATEAYSEVAPVEEEYVYEEVEVPATEAYSEVAPVEEEYVYEEVEVPATEAYSEVAPVEEEYVYEEVEVPATEAYSEVAPVEIAKSEQNTNLYDGLVLGDIKIIEMNNQEGVIELTTKSEEKSIVGSVSEDVIRINVGSSSFGWNVAFDNGITMSLRDLQTYLQKNDSMFSNNGTIYYGTKKFNFSNIRRIVMYEIPQYFSYIK